VKLESNKPPREYNVGRNNDIVIKDCGQLHLAANEQVTFITERGGQYDVARKDWGFYATPSINGRLEKFGFRTALTRNSLGQFFVLLVENGSEKSFNTYLTQEAMSVIEWIDDASQTEPKNTAEPGCPICLAIKGECIFKFNKPPEKEIRLPASDTPYYREVHRCCSCGHFYGVHEIDLSTLYESEYVSATYGDQLRDTFERIMALPPEKSDNVGRVDRVHTFAQQYFGQRLTQGWQPSLLDVGSGLGVFPARMSALGWHCTALDPDSRQAAHARDVVGIEAIHGDFMKAKEIAHYSAITFNKVLEHVSEPAPMLRRARQFLDDEGFIYIELPDGEAAAAEGEIRSNEEFTVDHLHVFSATSLSLLATQAGFRVHTLERLQEPSGKYTLRAFLIVDPV
jgi:SAM-dependent methyltransferase